MDKNRIIDYISQMGITLSDAQALAFAQYYELLIEWNSFMNLTAITEPEDVLIKHFADSLALKQLDLLWNDAPSRLLDIGTGAGFPAVPLKIAVPQLEITMIDSLNKRVNFLNEVIDQLDLKNISAVHGRAEEHARNNDYREQFDIVVSRAVANMAVLAEYCLPYVKPGGYFVAYKSVEFSEGSEQDASENAITLLGGKLQSVEHYQLPETDLSRCLVLIHKTKSTPDKYPRKSAAINKKPL